MLLATQNPIALAIICIGFGMIVILYRAFTGPLDVAPGPWHSRFTRLSLSIAIVTGRRPGYVDSLHRKYGTHVCIAPDELAVSDIESFHHIHRIGTDFIKSDWYHKLTGSRLRRSMLTFTNAKDHSVRRRMFSRSMSRKSLLENWHDTVKDMTSLAVHKMHDVAAREGDVDMLDRWTSMAMDVVGRSIYGRSFRNLEPGDGVLLSEVSRTNLLKRPNRNSVSASNNDGLMPEDEFLKKRIEAPTALKPNKRPRTLPKTAGNEESASKGIQGNAKTQAYTPVSDDEEELTLSQLSKARGKAAAGAVGDDKSTATPVPTRASSPQRTSPKAKQPQPRDLQRAFLDIRAHVNSQVDSDDLPVIFLECRYRKIHERSGSRGLEEQGLLV
ncbi:hypothetical protein MBLNU13_g00611t2 [Cladosporium sp. NU13]